MYFLRHFKLLFNCFIYHLGTCELFIVRNFTLFVILNNISVIFTKTLKFIVSQRFLATINCVLNKAVFLLHHCNIIRKLLDFRNNLSIVFYKFFHLLGSCLVKDTSVLRLLDYRCYFSQWGVSKFGQFLLFHKVVWRLCGLTRWNNVWFKNLSIDKTNSVFL